VNLVEARSNLAQAGGVEVLGREVNRELHALTLVTHVDLIQHRLIGARHALGIERTCGRLRQLFEHAADLPPQAVGNSLIASQKGRGSVPTVRYCTSMISSAGLAPIPVLRPKPAAR
jgi:hypothetical protein